MKIILFSLLLFFSTNALTGNWKKISENKSGSEFYVAVDNIKKCKEFTHYFLLIDYPDLTKIGTYSDIG